VHFHILKKHRSIGCGALYTFCLSAAFLIITYYLPEWYQLVLGVSPIQSGINTLPVIIGFAVAALMAGAAVGGIGYYVPPMLVASIFAAIGAGLMSTFTPSSNSSHWIGYTALFGLGIGAGIQQPEVAVQALLDRTEVPVGFALMAFAQSMGGAVFVSVAQNIFGQKIISGDLGGQAGQASGSNPLCTNVAGLLNSVPADQKQKILDTYNGALTYVFLVAAIMAAISFIFALCMEWKSVKTEKKPKGGDEDTSRDEEEKVE
jgi:MFS family permease